jgi:hypothetical protein
VDDPPFAPASVLGVTAVGDEIGRGGTRVHDLTGATIESAPSCCVGCVWWQQRRDGRPVEKRRWIRGVEDAFGPWGKLYVDRGRTIASLQYGPADVFPRAQGLPAGPPSSDAVLLTCAFLLDASSPWALQSLFLACLGEVRDGGHPAVEGFGYRYDEDESFRTRFGRHHTVFPREFLADFGFRTLRTAGRVELMRLELRGLLPVEDEGEWALVRAWEAIKARRRVTVPAAP